MRGPQEPQEPPPSHLHPPGPAASRHSTASSLTQPGSGSAAPRAARPTACSGRGGAVSAWLPGLDTRLAPADVCQPPSPSLCPRLPPSMLGSTCHCGDPESTASSMDSGKRDAAPRPCLAGQPATAPAFQKILSLGTRTGREVGGARNRGRPGPDSWRTPFPRVRPGSGSGRACRGRRMGKPRPRATHPLPVTAAHCWAVASPVPVFGQRHL